MYLALKTIENRVFFQYYHHLISPWMYDIREFIARDERLTEKIADGTLYTLVYNNLDL